LRILVVEDDTEVTAYLERALESEGHVVACVSDGDAALIEAAHGDYGVLIVDRMLPGLDGIAVIKALRAMARDVPVLILSALGDVDHRVEGLRAGGDDYLVKPFAFSELLARVEALARRPSSTADTTTLEVGDLSLNLLSREARRGETRIDLQPREFSLLEYLMRHADQVVTRTMLLEAVWDLTFDPQTNVVDVHISRLRQKIDKDFETPLIHTIRRAGYMLRAGA
jgi:two-component system OmpR family response regulator